MDEIIKRIAFFTPDTPDEMPSCGDTSFNQDDSYSGSSGTASDQDHGNLQNYMFFRNLKAMRDHIDEILKMDAQNIDQKLTEHHDWATDHIASAHENLEQVYGWLSADNGSPSTCESTIKTDHICEDQCPVCGAGHISGDNHSDSTRSDRQEVSSDDYDDDNFDDEFNDFDNDFDLYDEDEDLDDLYGGYR